MQDLVAEVVLGFMALAVMVPLVLVVLCLMEPPATQKPKAVLVLYHSEVKTSLESKVTAMAEVRTMMV
jgi:hypothetical protein